MIKKRNPMCREVRCLYKALLRNNGKMLDLKKMIEFYEEYNDLRDRAVSGEEAPSALKNNLFPLKMPKYLQWVKQYLI